MTVNGEPVTRLGAVADPEKDEIRVDGKPVTANRPRLYLVLNKPEGYVSTVRDPHAERTVMDLLRGVPERVYPVGRLDAETAGLLLLTNDGDLTNQLLHPSHAVPRTYRAVVRGLIDEFALTDLRKGVALEDGLTAPAEVELIERDERRRVSVVELTLHEGRKRQVRRMLDMVGYPVLALTRTRFGPITLEGLAPGTWRKLRPHEVEALRAAARGASGEPEDGM